MAVYVPRPYQPAISNFIFDHPRCYVAGGMGIGKGSATLAAISSLVMFGEVQHVLVIAPKRVAQTTWPGEIEQFKESFGHLSYAVAVGSDAERRAAIEQRAVVTMINFDVLTWLVDNYGDSWYWDMVVPDEATRLKSARLSFQRRKRADGTLGPAFLTGQGGTRARSLATVIFKKVKRVVCLSGTPASNGLIDLWAQYFFLDAGQRLGSSFTAFSHRWFRAKPGSTQEQQQLEPLPYADEQIRRAVRDITIAIEAKDHFNLPPLIENVIRVELPDKARKAYREMERELLCWIEQHPIEAFNAGAKSQKCLQIASGAAYTDDQGNWAPVHDAKLEALDSVIEEAAGAPIIVAYHFKSDLARIRKAFPKAEVLGSDPKTIARWNKGQIPILLAHPQSAGHGLSLQHGGNIICFFTSNWSLENDLQIVERIGPTRQAQSGYNRPVFVHRIVAARTLDEVVIARLKSKASVQDALMEALKHR
jgi:SNF2 family DNA or RNA helicase